MHIFIKIINSGGIPMVRICRRVYEGFGHRSNFSGVGVLCFISLALLFLLFISSFPAYASETPIPVSDHNTGYDDIFQSWTGKTYNLEADEIGLKIDIKLNHNIMVMRVGKRWNYHFLFFEFKNLDWILFDRIDALRQKYRHPEIVFLSPDLLYYGSLMMSGTGVSYYEYLFYSISAGKLHRVLEIPAQGHVSDWGMPFNREFDSEMEFSNGAIHLDYTIKVTAAASYRGEGIPEENPGGFSLFEASKRVVYSREGDGFQLDQDKSQLTAAELNNLFNGGSSQYYEMFKPEFDRLRNGSPEERRWYEAFTGGLIEDR